MKILHTYCLNYNLGDHALGMGVKNVLRHFLDVDFIAETNLQGQVFDDYFIDVVNNRFDLLVIGGGGIIHGAHWPAGWFWLIKKEDIQKLHIPFIVYGAGYNYFRGEADIPERGIEHLWETQSRSLYFSVRNDGSHERLLTQTGIDADVVADPGFWVSLNRNYHRPIREKFVVVQLADDKPAFRFGTRQNRAAFIDHMRTIVEYIASRYSVIMAPHVLADVSICKEVAAGIENVNLWDFGSYAFDRVHECLGYYQYADFVLAMRGHGQILPLGFGIPVISLDTHEKNLGLMRNLGMENYNVAVNDSCFLDKVITLVDDLPIDTSLANRILANNLDLFAGTAERYANIVKLLMS